MTRPASPLSDGLEPGDLQPLASAYLDGLATDADVRRLEALLAADAEARARFMDLCVVNAQLAMCDAALSGDGPRTGGAKPPPTRGFPFGRVAGIPLAITLAAASVMLMLGLGRHQPAGVPEPALEPYYDNRELPLITVATLRPDQDGRRPGGPLTPATLRSPAGTRLRALGGASVWLPGDSVFGFSAADGGTLYEGSVQARVEAAGSTFKVTAGNLRIVDLGTAFDVTRINENVVCVTVTEGEVEIQSRVRLPVCYWPFDTIQRDERQAGKTVRRTTADEAGGLVGVLGPAVQAVPGIVGRGALRFGNTSGDLVDVVGGTDPQVGAGLLSASEGITIEALVMPAWSGRDGDYEEIYRKEDGIHRVLLAFQNDRSRHEGHADPPVPAGPCLAFGLHLVGHGYAELDMPLDGREGRPSLAELTDGKPHHVVATYDSFRGRKAIFVDGRLRFKQVYPRGTMVLCGGPAAPTIGNHGTHKPFTGVIDELACYDFALTEDEVALHWANAAAGRNYFGVPPRLGAARWQEVTRLVEGQQQCFDQQNGLPVDHPEDPS